LIIFGGIAVSLLLSTVAMVVVSLAAPASPGRQLAAVFERAD
jgi:hypothetical protein